jgi:hypothetical protein
MTEDSDRETIERLWEEAAAARGAGRLEQARASAQRLVALLEHRRPDEPPHYGHAVGLLSSIERMAGTPGADSVITRAIDRLPVDAQLDRSHLEVVQAVALSESDRLAEAAQQLRSAIDHAGAGLAADREWGLDVLSDAIRVG